MIAMNHRPLDLKRLGDVDQEVLRALVERTVRVHRGADRAIAGP